MLPDGANDRSVPRQPRDRPLPPVPEPDNMCMFMHTIDEAALAAPPPADSDDCQDACLHPAAVAAARAHAPTTAPPERLAALFATLGDPTRVRLLTALAAGELCVCDLAAATGVNRTTVSHQLRLLRERRFVRRRRAGKVVYYALDDDHVAALLTMGAAHAVETERDERVPDHRAMA